MSYKKKQCERIVFYKNTAYCIMHQPNQSRTVHALKIVVDALKNAHH